MKISGNNSSNIKTEGGSKDKYKDKNNTELSYYFGIQKNELKASDYYSELIQTMNSGTFKYVSVLYCWKWSLMKALSYDLNEDLSVNISLSEKKDSSILVKEITDLVSEMMQRSLSLLI